ncbi:hypothetical protein ERJ75_001332200 [Trypanosoma vivax]|uniref:Uncharacterized protein n=1 Tax=Trypanosoma vivax (strain Y486) TaxID=1055687 RepID=G0TRQ9_TRYVY|nr:hypothetical protein TRVL_07811 [Trypanosoma vivax]KAH8608279.1 hypothetical protein ERJ75_001332200 [Trypanosoma vivax]CCC46631.1 conserved hypothetical protein [Trypanosoma vivax Y486]
MLDPLDQKQPGLLEDETVSATPSRCPIFAIASSSELNLTNNRDVHYTALASVHRALEAVENLALLNAAYPPHARAVSNVTSPRGADRETVMRTSALTQSLQSMANLQIIFDCVVDVAGSQDINLERAIRQRIRSIQMDEKLAYPSAPASCGSFSECAKKVNLGTTAALGSENGMGTAVRIPTDSLAFQENRNSCPSNAEIPGFFAEHFSALTTAEDVIIEAEADAVHVETGIATIYSGINHADASQVAAGKGHASNRCTNSPTSSILHESAEGTHVKNNASSLSPLPRAEDWTRITLAMPSKQSGEYGEEFGQRPAPSGLPVTPVSAQVEVKDSDLCLSFGQPQPFLHIAPTALNADCVKVDGMNGTVSSSDCTSCRKCVEDSDASLETSSSGPSEDTRLVNCCAVTVFELGIDAPGDGTSGTTTNEARSYSKDNKMVSTCSSYSLGNLVNRARSPPGNLEGKASNNAESVRSVGLANHRKGEEDVLLSNTDIFFSSLPERIAASSTTSSTVLKRQAPPTCDAWPCDKALSSKPAPVASCYPSDVLLNPCAIPPCIGSTGSGGAAVGGCSASVRGDGVVDRSADEKPNNSVLTPSCATPVHHTPLPDQFSGEYEDKPTKRGSELQSSDQIYCNSATSPLLSALCPPIGEKMMAVSTQWDMGHMSASSSESHSIVHREQSLVMAQMLNTTECSLVDGTLSVTECKVGSVKRAAVAITPEVDADVIPSAGSYEPINGKKEKRFHSSQKPSAICGADRRTCPSLTNVATVPYGLLLLQQLISEKRMM